MTFLKFHPRSVFFQLAETLFANLKNNEVLALYLEGENTTYTRINNSKIRQTGFVDDVTIQLDLYFGKKRMKAKQVFSGVFEQDQKNFLETLGQLQKNISHLPEDSLAVPPQSSEKSEEVFSARLLPDETTVAALLPPMQKTILTGLYTAGQIYRGYANSNGARHWFADDSYHFDYSLMNPQEQMVKGVLSGNDWDQTGYETHLQDSITKLEKMSLPLQNVPRGSYRTYFAPTALSSLVYLLSWGGICESGLQQGQSVFAKMRDQNQKLSPLFNLAEDFTQIRKPRFNEAGEMAPQVLPLISEGRLQQVLVNSRSAKEYGVVSNFADDEESLRAPCISAGSLAENQILSELRTGLYLSDLHYLNWSDRPGGRVTGMTRYACFWVEGGEIKGPIQNLRFDDSFYHFLGKNLVALTTERVFSPYPLNYSGRGTGGVLSPGFLANDFKFTL